MIGFPFMGSWASNHITLHNSGLTEPSKACQTDDTRENICL